MNTPVASLPAVWHSADTIPSTLLPVDATRCVVGLALHVPDSVDGGPDIRQGYYDPAFGFMDANTGMQITPRSWSSPALASPAGEGGPVTELTLPELIGEAERIATNMEKTGRYLARTVMRELCRRLATTEQPGCCASEGTYACKCGIYIPHPAESSNTARSEQPGSAVQGEAEWCEVRDHLWGRSVATSLPLKDMPEGRYYTTPPPAPAAEQGEPIGTGNAPTSCDQCREEWPAYLLKDGLCIKCRKATQPEARGVEGCHASEDGKHSEMEESPGWCEWCSEQIAATPNPVRAEQPEVQGAWPSEAKAAADGDGWVAISRGIEHRMSKDQARVWNGCRTACIATAPAAPGAAVGVDEAMVERALAAPLGLNTKVAEMIAHPDQYDPDKGPKWKRAFMRAALTAALAGKERA